MDVTEKICPLCAANLKDFVGCNDSSFYSCPVCGQFQLDKKEEKNINRNHLAAYLVYHAFINDPHTPTSEYRFYTTRKKGRSLENGTSLKTANPGNMEPIYIDNDIIEAWYPKRFSERIDQILLYIANHTEHIGQPLQLSVSRLLNVLFVDRQEIDKRSNSPTEGQWIIRNENELIQETNYMLRYLRQQSYIEADDFTEFKKIHMVLTPKGYARVDELQKNTANGRNVLVAMSFNHTEVLREAIRKGITLAGYNAIFIDEVPHNNFITPELLKHIRDSKFVVVDLTHGNRGAYFEEGYAMGLGKPVIQLCKRDVPLHFDIAQKNTIMWDSEDDIPEKLCNRIKATID